MLSYDPVLEVISRTTQLMQIVFVNLLLVFNINYKYNYPGRSKCNSAINQEQLLAVEPLICFMTSSYMTPSQDTKTFTSLTPDRIVVKPCAVCPCVWLFIMQQPKSIMTFLRHSADHDIWPGLTSYFQIDLSRSKCICSMHLDAKNTVL